MKGLRVNHYKLLILILCFVLLGACSESPKQIEEANVVECVGTLFKGKNIPSVSYKLGKEQIKKLNKILVKSSSTSSPAKWQELGIITIKFESSKRNIYIYSSYDKGAFEIDEIYYRGSSNSEFRQLISSGEKIIE